MASFRVGDGQVWLGRHNERLVEVGSLRVDRWSRACLESREVRWNHHELKLWRSAGLRNSGRIPVKGLKYLKRGVSGHHGEEKRRLHGLHMKSG